MWTSHYHWKDSGWAKELWVCVCPWVATSTQYSESIIRTQRYNYFHREKHKNSLEAAPAPTENPHSPIISLAHWSILSGLGKGQNIQLSLLQGCWQGLQRWCVPHSQELCQCQKTVSDGFQNFGPHKWQLQCTVPCTQLNFQSTVTVSCYQLALRIWVLSCDRKLWSWLNVTALVQDPCSWETEVGGVCWEFEANLIYILNSRLAWVTEFVIFGSLDLSIPSCL